MYYDFNEGARNDIYVYMCHAVAIVYMNFEERFEFTALVVFGRIVLLNVDIYACAK